MTERRVDLDGIVELAMQFWQGGATDELLGSRLARADTVVHVHITDGDDSSRGFTLLMDRAPIEVVPGFAAAAEVEIFGDAAVWLALVRQETRMPMAIASGQMRYTGPVRKFLRVVPMLQNFDFEMWAGVRLDE